MVTFYGDLSNYCRNWSTQATSFRPNPFHANYFLNVYNMSSMHLNKILFKPNYCKKILQQIRIHPLFQADCVTNL